MTLPQCPIVGCQSDSDHHWHWNGQPDMIETCDGDDWFCQCTNPLVRCYSAKRSLMLSVETVAAMIAHAEGVAYRRGWEKGWAEIWDTTAGGAVIWEE